MNFEELTSFYNTVPAFKIKMYDFDVINCAGGIKKNYFQKYSQKSEITIVVVLQSTNPAESQKKFKNILLLVKEHKKHV